MDGARQTQRLQKGEKQADGWDDDDDLVAQIDTAKAKEEASLLSRQTAVLENLANAVTRHLEAKDASEDKSDEKSNDGPFEFTAESEDEDGVGTEDEKD